MKISFTVYGKAQTAGSKRAFPFRKKNGGLGVAVSDDNPNSRDWKNAVACEASKHFQGELLTGPISLRLTFYRPRPKGHVGKNGLNGTGKAYPRPTTKPDALKLARAVEDALTGVIWLDDSHVVEESLSKHWGEPARVEIEIETL